MGYLSVTASSRVSSWSCKFRTRIHPVREHGSSCIDECYSKSTGTSHYRWRYPWTYQEEKSLRDRRSATLKPFSHINKLALYLFMLPNARAAALPLNSSIGIYHIEFALFKNGHELAFQLLCWQYKDAEFAFDACTKQGPVFSISVLLSIVGRTPSLNVER